MTRYPNADDASLTFSLFTMPWTRRYARRLELHAKKCGLGVEYEHDNGWTLRYHLITATGPVGDVQRYSKTIDRWCRLKAGLPADRDKEMADLWARITKDTP